MLGWVTPPLTAAQTFLYTASTTLPIALPVPLPRHRHHHPPQVAQH